MPKKRKNVYLDFASGVRPNAGAIHGLGLKARRKIEKARKTIADILSAGSDEIIFTGSGTEGNNLAILGTQPRHIVTTNIEHPSVLEPAKMFNTTYVPVESNGLVDPEKIKEAIRPDTVLVSVHYANNEIGTIQPIREIAKIIRAKRKQYGTSALYFHIDACQAARYLPLNVEKLGVDLMTLSGTKISEPGIGILYKKRGVELAPIMRGGDQELGLRPGTENAGLIARLAGSMEKIEKIKEREKERLLKLQKYFIGKLKKIPKVIINGDLIGRLPNNVNISVSGIESELLVLELDARGIFVSAKSACKSWEVGESYVIKALRPDSRAIEGSIRFSLGPATKKADIDYTLSSLKAIFEKLKKWYN